MYPCNLQFVNTLTDSISYANADLYPNYILCHIICYVMLFVMLYLYNIILFIMLCKYKCYLLSKYMFLDSSVYMLPIWHHFVHFYM